MLKKNSTTTTKNGGVISSSIINNNNNWSRECDTCRSAACKVYCHADSAYLCSGCDASIHAANRVASRHERVLVCEACEHAPAAFFCKADAASLCSSCDAEIHSANALASRHQRVPLYPFSGCLQQHHHHHLRDRDHEDDEEVVDEEEDEAEAEAASWLLLNPVKNNEEDSETGGFLFDEYLDLVDCNSCGDDDDNNKFSNVYYDNHREKEHNYSTVYAVVPVQCGGEGEGQAHVQQQFQHGFYFDSSKAGFSYDGSLSQSVSVSSMDVGVVPESTISDISISHSRSSIGTSDLFAPIPMPSHLTPMDREAKVLRYREKKKTRKFEKKIRYVSRKAYAENRPRIKGRFAKRTDIEADQVDQMHSTTLITEAGCSIVPSFQISIVDEMARRQKRYMGWE